jgi:hypothetical protein
MRALERIRGVRHGRFHGSPAGEIARVDRKDPRVEDSLLTQQIREGNRTHIWPGCSVRHRDLFSGWTGGARRRIPRRSYWSCPSSRPSLGHPPPSARFRRSWYRGAPSEGQTQPRPNLVPRRSPGRRHRWGMPTSRNGSTSRRPPHSRASHCERRPAPRLRAVSRDNER